MQFSAAVSYLRIKNDQSNCNNSPDKNKVLTALILLLTIHRELYCKITQTMKALQINTESQLHTPFSSQASIMFFLNEIFHKTLNPPFTMTF